MKSYIAIPLALLLLGAFPLVSADVYEVTEDDEEVFDNILEPVGKIYGLVQYGASLVALLFLTYAGISYMSAGNDSKKRDNAKSTAAYVIIGLVVIWASPFLVNYLVV